MGLSLFDLFFDSDYRQRGDINAASRDAEIARFHGDLALESVDALRKQVLAQREQIRELGAMVSVLVKMLSESGSVDDKVLRYRVESQLEELREAARPENQLLACTRCGKQVPAAQTQLTGDGPVCDRCAAMP